jgi:hypothetical protein
MKNETNRASHLDWLTDLAGGELTGAELRDLLTTRFQTAEDVDDALRQIEIVRRVRDLMTVLSQAEIKVPDGFEGRLMARVSQDQTLLEMLELYVTGFGFALIELLNALFSLVPDPEPEPALA